MIESILYKTAIYCRLSLDDGSLRQSGSIHTQKMILEKYCRDNNFTINKVYIDDGYSGLNFDRLAFKRLNADIESGKRQRALNGLFISTRTPYGYTKDPTNKNHLIVDGDVRHVVELIFNMCINGKGAPTIAKVLE